MEFSQTNKTYNVLYADPPWKFSSKDYTSNFKPLTDHYPVMTNEVIMAVPVQPFIADDCALFLWTTDAHLPTALKVIAAWGFQYKTVGFVWVKRHASGKPKVNMAPWTMKSCELCLFGTKGRMTHLKKSNNVRQLIEATLTRHSSKPYETRLRIEQLFGDVPRLELFARFKGPGWDVWGNEVESDIKMEVT